MKRDLTGGFAALAFLAVLAGGALAGLAAVAVHDWRTALSAFDPAFLAALRFTLLQAVLSTLLSVAPAIPVARAFFHLRAFPGRALLLQLFALPLAIPAIVASIGVLALWGRAGYFAPVLASVSDGSWPGIFGLPGILIAHVFFNLPLATRLFLEALEAVPADRWRLSAQLGMNGRNAFRLIEWPALRAVLPGVAMLVFMLCVTSFVVVLTLGGGPASTTIEVAIYQALRFDFDPARAMALTLAQLALTGAVLAVAVRLGASMSGEANLTVAHRLFLPARKRAATLANAALLIATAAFVAGPLMAILVAGLAADLAGLLAEAQFWRATVTSLILAMLAGVLAVAMALGLSAMRWRMEAERRKSSAGLGEWLAGHGAALILVMPPAVIGAGWFVALQRSGLAFAAAPVMIVAVNAAMAMPFATRILRPAHDAAATRHDRLAANLGIAGWTRFRIVDWPALRRPLLSALAFAMALSLGDLGVIALFGGGGIETLPWLLHARMGSYRTDDAAGLALLLGLLCLGLAFLSMRSGDEARS